MTSRKYIVYMPPLIDIKPKMFLGWNRHKKQFQFYPEQEKAHIWLRKKDAKLVSSIIRDSKMERIR